MSGYPQVNGSEQPEPSLRRAGRGRKRKEGCLALDHKSLPRT